MIYITKELRIRKLDENALQLEKYVVVEKKNGEKEHQWRWCGYYGDVKSALIGALKKQLFELGGEEELSVKQVLERIEKAEKNIICAIDTNYD